MEVNNLYEMRQCIQTAWDERQFYESALTDHKNEFLFITKTQQSLQQQFIIVVAATNTRPAHPTFETLTDTSDLLKSGGYVRVGW